MVILDHREKKVYQVSPAKSDDKVNYYLRYVNKMTLDSFSRQGFPGAPGAKGNAGLPGRDGLKGIPGDSGTYKKHLRLFDRM